MHRHQFDGPNAALERAIEDDDPAGVDAALRAGASANARGAQGVTPAEYAVGLQNRQAAAALFRHKADPNLKDAAGDNAVTIAVKLYARDPSLLAMVLDAGGDPNTREPDGDPVINEFAAASDLDAITFLHRHGADLDVAVRNGDPLVVYAATATDWGVVQRLIELGADIDTPRTRDALVFTFRNTAAPPPGSPLYDAKVNVYRLLVAKGLHPMPPKGLTP